MFGRGKKQTPIAGKIDTLIAKSATVHGDVEFSGGLHLEGRVVGNVRGGALALVPGAAAEPCTLWISEPGTVEGTVDVPSVVINGSVVGDVIARERVVIGPHARISGNVQYGAIEMALGGEVSGKLMPISVGNGAGQAALTGPAAVSGSANVTALPSSTAFDARKAGP